MGRLTQVNRTRVAHTCRAHTWLLVSILCVTAAVGHSLRLCFCSSLAIQSATLTTVMSKSKTLDQTAEVCAGGSIDSVPPSSTESSPSTQPPMQVVRLADLEGTVQSLVTRALEKSSATEVNPASGGKKKKMKKRGRVLLPGDLVCLE